MATLLLRLCSPMQSWGITSHFDQRDTALEPSKSGILGLLSAACGIDRENWTDLKPLTQLRMGIRHDRPGIPQNDFQTAQHVISANQLHIHPTTISTRQYLADASFLVALESPTTTLLSHIQEALQDPVWPIFLGRKSYLPSEPIWFPHGLQDGSLRDTLEQWPWIARLRPHEAPPERLRLSFESSDQSGQLRMDQPLAAFAQRQFGIRWIQYDWIPFPQEASHVSSSH